MLNRVRAVAAHRSLGPFAFHALAYLSTRGLPFVAAFLAARLLGADEFGQFVGALSLFMSALMFVDLGLALTTITRVARQRAESEVAAGRSLAVAASVCLTLGALVSLSIGVMSEWLSATVFSTHAMRPYLLAGMLYVPAAGLASIITGGLQGLQRYRELAIVGIVGGVIHLLLVVGLAVTLGGMAALWGAAVAVAIRAALGLVFAGPVMLRSVRAKAAFHPVAELRALVARALPACLAAAAWAPVNTALVSRLFSHENGAAEAGAFGVAMQVFSLAMIVPGVLTQFALPRLAGVAGPDGARRRKLLTLRYSIVAGGVTLAISLPAMVFAPLVMDQLGRDYAGYSETLLLMLVAAVFSAPQGVLSNYMLAAGHDWQRVWTKYLWAGVVLLTAVVLSAPSASNAAVAYVCGWAALVAVQVFLVVRDRPVIGTAASTPAQ